MTLPQQVLSIQVGAIRSMTIGDREVKSAIRKLPVTGRIPVTPLGLQGDEQADPSVHGGLSQAVYAYPSEHYPYCQAQIRQADPSAVLSYGHVGENLTLSGLLETDAFVGDELYFPDCVLRITQPRLPCFKFNAVMKDKRAAKKMAQTGFSGFYLAVAEAGSIAAGETFRLVAGERQTSIGELFRVAMKKTAND